jgi:8-oxo-dGTP pyrophosphatase MutT (NUDIX family)
MTKNVLMSVTVSTASVIIFSHEDPYKVLIADSQKHSKPIIPGGKIEREEAFDKGLNCIQREVMEEVGTSLQNPELIGVAGDITRDIRIVPFSKIKEALTDPLIPHDTFHDVLIKAHYGCPDYIYRGTVDECFIQNTEELNNLRFIDIRKLELGDLSAGHDVILLVYRKMLDENEPYLSAHSLQNFEKDRKSLLYYLKNKA